VALSGGKRSGGEAPHRREEVVYVDTGGKAGGSGCWYAEQLHVVVLAMSVNVDDGRGSARLLTEALLWWNDARPWCREEATVVL
jgi:hypothetical protein